MSKYLEIAGSFVCLCLFFQTVLLGQTNSIGNQDIVSGELWKDTDGNVINAHGGGIILHKGKYY